MSQVLFRNGVQEKRLSEVEGYELLSKLALNLSWSWSHTSDRVWRELNQELWELTRNPWVVLQTVSQEKLKSCLTDPNFLELVHSLLKNNEQIEKTPRWFQKNFPNSPLTCCAYFSMEFMLTEALPIYSGGLGNVAGDQLKAASDLGVPVIAVGLLYQQGYFRQVIDIEGQQQALFPYNDPGQLPITPLRKENGEWIRLEVSLPGWSAWIRAWQVQVGRVKLFLLDSNDAANYPAHRGITSELYGGGSELRLKQELILGIGGWRLFSELGITPEVCHLNEGHAAFAVLERAREFMEKNHVPFEVALTATRAGNFFTTHTAVPAGFDRFSPELIAQYLTRYTQDKLKISLNDLLALGRFNPDDSKEAFNMAYLAMRGSGAINGVSQLHGKVSKHLFSSLFPHWPVDEVPVGYVTNGVHMPSWDSEPADALWTDSCGHSRWLGPTESLEKEIRALSDEKIWNMRSASRKIFVDFARDRNRRQLGVSGASKEEIEQAKHIFDPHILTLGFARRFATYKRPNMLLHDPERLLRILNNPDRPVQLVVAGKAHPQDKPGQALIEEWNHFIKRPEARFRVLFLSDYDMLLTEYLVLGVDVWINTPRRPWEACGTSGMKVLVNGGLNLSELDGWWAEAYTKEVGWAIGDGKEHGDDPVWDAFEAQDLYNILENEIIPEFYSRNDEGIPSAWVHRIRESMATLTPQYSANRAVREYTKEYYIPAATNYRQRAKDNGALAVKIYQWEQALKENWPSIRFENVKVETENDQHKFEIALYLDDIDPKALKVELYAAPFEGMTSFKTEMKQIKQLPGDQCTYLFQAFAPSNRPASHYTPRVIPNFPGVAVPQENQQILWQK